MPEILSAKEFAGYIQKEIDWDREHLQASARADFTPCIRYRDSSMLEKYKEAICKGCDGYCTRAGRLKCAHMVALDSAFAEIEGGYK